jgi:hypothetical protein
MVQRQGYPPCPVSHADDRPQALDVDFALDGGLHRLEVVAFSEVQSRPHSHTGSTTHKIICLLSFDGLVMPWYEKVQILSCYLTLAVERFILRDG